MNCRSLVFSLLAATGIFCAGCDQPSHQLEKGMWRGALLTESGAEIPFNFEVSDSIGKSVIYIINGKERMKADEIKLQDDSVFIRLPFYDSELKGELTDGQIDGQWIKHLADRDAVMEFHAEHGVSWRIKEKTAKPKVDISGKWETTFTATDGTDSTKAIGEFQQEGNHVTGTFITRTGDYRFLDGVMDGNQLSLSTFDGGFALLFTATATDSTLSNGKAYFGFSGQEIFSAKRNADVQLEDAYGLTYLKPGYEKIDFSFPNLDKEQVSLSDEQFKNKVIVVQIMGSWCPNCMDETAFLSEFKNKHQFDDVAFVGLAYERTTDFEKSKKNLQRVIDRFKVNYPILITGYTSSKGEPAKSLPMLNHVMAFPTTIIIDKKGKVRKIHTGFSGPGTGSYYEEFKKEFEQLIADLRKE